MMVSPLTMSFMIAFRCYPHPKDEVGLSWDSEAGREARRWLFLSGLIDREDEHGHATDKGKAWLDRALSTPLPVARWEFPSPTDGGSE